jgi:hypothetical protein
MRQPGIIPVGLKNKAKIGCRVGEVQDTQDRSLLVLYLLNKGMEAREVGGNLKLFVTRSEQHNLYREFWVWVNNTTITNLNKIYTI